jgi:hypothetical protein
MSTETQEIIIIGILVFVLWILISGALWWVVLWSFDFPILFAWKQVIGVAIITGSFSPKTFKKTKKVKK